MKVGNPDLEKLRVALRGMDRGNLLIVAERAIDIVPKAKLGALIGDMVRLEEIEEGKRGVIQLLAEVRKFHEASLDGEYYESFKVDSGNFMEKSAGTDAFIAEFERLIAKRKQDSSVASYDLSQVKFEESPDAEALLVKFIDRIVLQR